MENFKDDFGSDDELYASYEAYKALMEAGISKEEALSRSGLTPQIIRDFELEEDEDEFKSEFKEVWDDDDTDADWKDSDLDLDDDADWADEGDDHADSADWEERY